MKPIKRLVLLVPLIVLFTFSLHAQKVGAAITPLISRETVLNQTRVFSYPGLPFVTWTEAGVGNLWQLALVRDPAGILNRTRVEALLLEGRFEVLEQGWLRNYGPSTGSNWYAFMIVNPTDKGSQTMMEVSGFDVDFLQIHQIRVRNPVSTTWVSETLGSDQPFSKRSIPVTSTVVNATVPPMVDSLVIIEVQSRGPQILHFSLFDNENFLVTQEEELVFYVLFIGVLLTLMLYNSFILGLVRDKVYFWFILHLLFATLFIIAISGLGYKYFWPNYPAFQVGAAGMIRSLFVIVTGLFLRSLLDLKRHLPTTDRFFTIFLAISFLLLVILPISGSTVPMFNVSLMLQAFILALAVIAVCRRQALSLTLALGWAFVCLGSVLWFMAINVSTLHPTLTYLFFHAHLIFLLVEVMVFSFGLSRRLQRLKQEKEEAEAKNRLKQSFIANISHEMRTPLNAIVGFSEAIRDAASFDEVKGYNQSVIEESERLLFQINQVLDIAKIEADKLVIEQSPFCLGDSLDYLFRANHSKARRQGIDLFFSIPRNCPTTVVGDRLRLEQVLRNLLDNAIKFTEKGSVQLTVHCQDLEGGALSRISFAVNDTGIGIPAHALAGIFDDFKQVDSSITRRFGGTGLGTSISRRLVAAMGGTLKVESTYGKGSTFSFTLDFQRGVDSEASGGLEACLDPTDHFGQAPASPGSSTTSDFQALVTAPALPQAIDEAVESVRPRVLVVDDFETNLKVVAIHLAKEPYELSFAQSGEEAIQAIQSKPFDIVLLDIFMPGMSGYDVVRWIRQQQSYRDLPVLGLTASGYEQDINDAISSGMNGVLVKPVRRAALSEAIEKQLHPMKNT